VAELPVSALVQRFGKTGKTLHRLASGKDTSPVAVYTPPVVIDTIHHLEQAIEDHQILQALLAHLLRQLAAQPAVQNQGIGQLGLALVLENGTAWEHLQPLRSPAYDVEQLLAVAHEILALATLDTGVVTCRVTLSGFTPVAARQLSLFERDPVSSDDLQRILTGLIAQYGDNCFYRATLVNPDARLPERRVSLAHWGDEP
jgi:hypothetical protein